LSIIPKIILAVTLIFSLTLCGRLHAENLIGFNDNQLRLPSDYIFISEFKDYPKYLKYEDQLLVSSFFIKNKAACLDFCNKSFEGKVYSKDGSDKSKRLRLISGNGYSASLWDMEFTNSEGTKNITMGIIYNNNTLLQVFDDKALWLSLLSQLKSKSKNAANKPLKQDK
jgi:hypothetical protein